MDRMVALSKLKKANEELERLRKENAKLKKELSGSKGITSKKSKK